MARSAQGSRTGVKILARDLGVYEKADEKEAVAKYGITSVDTKWIDTE